MKIAIMSPSKNPYSETFIQAHKEYLDGEIFYYYGKVNQLKLEGFSDIVPQMLKRKIKLQYKLSNNTRSLSEQLLIESLKFHRIDVILVEYGTHAYKLLSVLKKINTPFIVHFHGYDASIKNVIKTCENYKSVFELASKVIVVSRAMENKLLELGCPQEKLIYNVYGPRPEFEKVNPKFNKEQFISIGRFTNKKAPYYVIIAFKEVAELYPNSRLVMAGDGDLLNTCKNLARYFKLEDRVDFVGVISPEKFRSYLSESIALIQHSIIAENGDMEGTPLSVLEASAAGLPVISTYHAGIPDVVINEETGLLSHEHDVESMTENMLKVLNNKKFATYLGNNGRTRVQKEFSLKSHIQTLNDELRKSIENKK